MMVQKKSQSELTLLLTVLLNDQDKARQDEVFGGLSPAERVEYNGRTERIHKLESDIRAGAIAERRLLFARSE
jgi:hypothetical protein